MRSNGELYSFLRSAGQTVASHRLDHEPILSEECCRIVKSFGLHSNAASLPSPASRYLKIEGIAGDPRVSLDGLSFAAHSVSPCPASIWDITFANRPFLRREYGATYFAWVFTDLGKLRRIKL